MNPDEPNLHELRKRVPENIAKDAASWAIIEAHTWIYGTYHPNDLTTMFEKGYLAGYLKGVQNDPAKCVTTKEVK